MARQAIIDAAEKERQAKLQAEREADQQAKKVAEENLEAEIQEVILQQIQEQLHADLKLAEQMRSEKMRAEQGLIEFKIRQLQEQELKKVQKQ